MADVARIGRVEPVALGRTIVVLGGFVLVAVFLGPWVVDGLFDFTSTVRSPVLTGFSSAVVLGIGMAAVALALGLEAVVGAFVAGVLVRNRLGGETARVLELVTLGVFAPVFFATAGLRADLTGLLAQGTLLVGAIVLVVAILGKVLGVAIGAAFTDLHPAETLCLAIGLNARGAMEIVVAALGLSLGILTPAIYTVVVVVAIVTSVMTPPLLRRALARVPDEGGDGRPGNGAAVA